MEVVAVKTTMKSRTYSELILLPTFEERLKYCMLDGSVGEATFGYERCLNQQFYRSREWKSIRRDVILRDEGCDLADPNYPIGGHIYVHHLNPITKDDILNASPSLLDPENLISVSYNTHQAITYGTTNPVPKPLVTRKPNDTCPWK